MKLVQMLLPVKSPSAEFKISYKQVLQELTQKFGGATAFSASPAEGIWDDGSERTFDNVVTVEVMVAEFDIDWWRQYRAALEAAFKQKEVIVRASDIVKI